MDSSLTFVQSVPATTGPRSAQNLVGRVERDTRDHPLARVTAVRLEETSSPYRSESRLVVLSPLEQAYLVDTWAARCRKRIPRGATGS